METFYYLLGAVLLSLLVFGAKAFIDSRVRAGVQHQFQLQLREHEHHLAALADRRQFEFQQRITDFTHLVSKRHETYARLWQLASKAHGKILEIATPWEVSYEYFDESDVEAFLVRREIPTGKRSEVLSRWMVSRTDGVHQLNEVVATYRVHTAIEAWIRYGNFLLARELYLPEDTVDAAKRLREYLNTLRIILQDPSTRDGPGTPGCRIDATRGMDVLKGLLKRDIQTWSHAAEAASENALASTM